MPYRGTTHFFPFDKRSERLRPNTFEVLLKRFLGAVQANNEKHEKQQGKDIQSGPGAVINGSMGCYGFARSRAFLGGSKF